MKPLGLWGTAGWGTSEVPSRILPYCGFPIWDGPRIVVESVLGSQCYWSQHCRLVWLWLAHGNQTSATWAVSVFFFFFFFSYKTTLSAQVNICCVGVHFEMTVLQTQSSQRSIVMVLPMTSKLHWLPRNLKASVGRRSMARLLGGSGALWKGH